MTELFTVHFTTQKRIKKLDSKGNVIAESQIDTPVTMTALPHATAKSYEGCDNFRMERYEPDARYTAKGNGRDAGVGNGTRKVSHVRSDAGARKGDSSLVAAAKKQGQSTLHNAAATGNMAGAING